MTDTRTLISNIDEQRGPYPRTGTASLESSEHISLKLSTGHATYIISLFSAGATCPA